MWDRDIRTLGGSGRRVLRVGELRGGKEGGIRTGDLVIMGLGEEEVVHTGLPFREPS